MTDNISFLTMLSEKQQTFTYMYHSEYIWVEAECEQLFEIIKEINEEQVKKHFWGGITLLLRKNEKLNGEITPKDELPILVGKQKFISFMLLIKALRDSNKCKEEEYIELLESCLKYTRFGVEIPKLTIQSKDYMKFHNLVYKDIKDCKENSFYKNYAHFLSLINDSNLEMEEIIEAIDKLTVNITHIDMNWTSSALIELTYKKPFPESA